MPLCGSRLQGQSLEEVDCHYVRSMVSVVQSALQQGAQPMLNGGHYSGLSSWKKGHKCSSQHWVIVALLMSSFSCFFSVSIECLWEVVFSSSGIYCRWERQHAVKSLSPSPLYTDSITAAPEAPAIRGSRDETQAEISIRHCGLEPGRYSFVSFCNL